MNAAQVRAKARMAMKRREEEVEQEEIEGGELNLVPYLDIVTNIMLFLLASVTTGLLVGVINSTLPEYKDPDAAGAAGDNKKDEKIQLVVAVTKPEIIMFSLSGLEGTLEAPKAKIPAREPGKEYEFQKLTDAAAEIVIRRGWDKLRILDTTGDQPLCLAPDKAPLPMEACRPAGATEVFLMVDGEIPYATVIAAMDALRSTTDGALPLFPGIIFSSGVTAGGN